MNPVNKPSPVRLEGRDRWGVAMIAGREVRMWADLVKARIVLHSLAPEPRDLGVVLNGLMTKRPLLVLNPQQWDWAGTASVRAHLLRAAVDYYNTVFSQTAAKYVENRGIRRDH